MQPSMLTLQRFSVLALLFGRGPNRTQRMMRVGRKREHDGNGQGTCGVSREVLEKQVKIDGKFLMS